MPEKIRLLNLLFHAIRKSEHDFVKYRHTLESQAFHDLEKQGGIKYLKLHEPDYEARNYDNVHFFKGRNRFFHLPLAMYRCIRKEKPDLLFIHSFIFPFQVVFLKWLVPKSTKLIIQHHAEKPFKHPVKRWLQRKAYAGADAYLFSSPDLATGFLEQGSITSKDKVYEVMEGSCLFGKKDKTAAREKLGIPDSTVFLWVGRLNQNKDPLTVLNAFKGFLNAGGDVKLYMIYGSTEMEQEVRQFIDSNGLSRDIVLVGKVAHVELEDWYNAADYFVSASYYEGSGIALCEAMACGCIPIVTDIASFRFMTEDGKYGYLYEAGNPEALLGHFLSLDKKKQAELEKEVVAKFERDLSFKGIGLKLTVIMDELLGNAPKR